MNRNEKANNDPRVCFKSKAQHSVFPLGWGRLKGTLAVPKSKIHTLCNRIKSEAPKLRELETPLALLKQERQFALLKQEILIDAHNEKR